MLSRISAAVLGQDKRGKPRCYMQGRWLSRFGLLPGSKVRVSYQDGLVVVLLDDEGPRKVSGKGEVPVIDLTGEELGRALGQDGAALEIRAQSGRIVIRPSRVEEQKRRRVQNGLEGSLFSGGGLLTEAAKQAGFRPSFAVEIEPRYAEVFESNHEGRMLNMSVHEVRAEDVPQVELLTVGLCCEPFSKKRRVAGSGLPPEAHPNGDLVVWALRAVEASNPWTVVVEQVPEFLDSGAGWILRHALARMGYTVEARVLDPSDYGELAGRRRAVIVATNDHEVHWPEPEPHERRLGEILEDRDDHEWFDADSKAWLFNHWHKQRDKGNRFFEGRQVLDAETKRVPCISKRYFAQQGDGVVVRHPEKPNTFRWLTLTEVKRLMGLTDDYELGTAKTKAGEILGQGVQVQLFRKVIEANKNPHRRG
jgi:site-specific DNA-cytosine methylase